MSTVKTGRLIGLDINMEKEKPYKKYKYLSFNICSIEPVCSTSVARVTFNETCLFQNGESCSYACNPGYSATAPLMLCSGGAWNLSTPCKGRSNYLISKF